MQFVQSVLVSILTLAVSLASVSCACANPVPDPANEPAPHIVHHEHGAPANTDCVEVGCGGNGGFTAVMPERAVPASDASDTFVDDDVPVPVVGSAFRSSTGFLVRPPSPPDLRWLAVASPVTRFDRLLN